MRVMLLSAKGKPPWHASGFAHGVLNTDNVALLGTTIDLNVPGHGSCRRRERRAARKGVLEVATDL